MSDETLQVTVEGMFRWIIGGMLTIIIGLVAALWLSINTQVAILSNKIDGMQNAISKSQADIAVLQIEIQGKRNR
jgi:hypothetical protein